MEKLSLWEEGNASVTCEPARDSGKEEDDDHDQDFLSKKSYTCGHGPLKICSRGGEER